MKMNLKNNIIKNNFCKSKDTSNIIVFSLGGSLIYPKKIDINYLIKFKKFIINFVSKNNKAIIVCGGGKICREYIKSAEKINKKINNENKDYLGISLTRANAELLRCIFEDNSYKTIIKDPYELIEFNQEILIAGGYKPGNSSDKMAVLLAKEYNSNLVINLTNIDMVYDKDPKKCNDAKPIPKISWQKFLKIIGEKWTPGMNVPFDPIASKIAMENNINTLIINGKNIQNLQNYFNSKEFIGTIISNNY
jgi:uridylate kinase